jgi:hypothetical protein
LPEGSVTVVDPRHPLFNQTFPLIEVTNHLAIGQCCRIWLSCGAERLVPLAATDRAAGPTTIFPLPLDAVSLQQLLQTYGRIMTQQMEAREDEADKREANNGVATAVVCANASERGETDSTRKDLAIIKYTATTGGLSNDCASMPPSRAKRKQGGG